MADPLRRRRESVSPEKDTCLAKASDPNTTKYAPNSAYGFFDHSCSIAPAHSYLLVPSLCALPKPCYGIALPSWTTRDLPRNPNLPLECRRGPFRKRKHSRRVPRSLLLRPPRSPNPPRTRMCRRAPTKKERNGLPTCPKHCRRNSKSSLGRMRNSCTVWRARCPKRARSFNST